MEDPKCEDLIDGRLESRMEAVWALWALECGQGTDEQQEKTRDEYGEFNEYGLCLEYVIRADEPSFFCWLLGTGGPHSEFRFYTDAMLRLDRVVFLYADWWDSAKRTLEGENLETMREIWEMWVDCETPPALLAQAQKEAD